MIYFDYIHMYSSKFNTTIFLHSCYYKIQILYETAFFIANCLSDISVVFFLLRLVQGPADYDVHAKYRGPSHSFGIRLPELPTQRQGMFRLYLLCETSKKKITYVR